MKIPFSPPFIDPQVEKEVLDTLHSGWITSGPKVQALEREMVILSGAAACVCVNSWSSGALLVLKWLGVGPGDEVIVPAYTYAATALVVLHVGATPVMVDVLEDFTVDPEAILKAITGKTKAIFPVDIGGWPCDYEKLKAIVERADVKKKFRPGSAIQQQFGRIALVSDAAHSIGALYKGAPSAKQCDISIYSLHAVKNITTAEGGVICLNLPDPFDNKEVYDWMKLNALNGQTKDAFTKTQSGGWRYDIVSLGLKINMPDICAAIGLAQIRQYKDCLLPARKRVFDAYKKGFGNVTWAQLPLSHDEHRVSSFHIYPLRIKGIQEAQRDSIIERITAAGVSVNVHFLPLPMLTLFKSHGYDISEYPVAHDNYSREISLPIYPQLTNDEIQYIVTTVIEAVESIIAA